MTRPRAIPSRIVVIAGYGRSLVHFRGPLLQELRRQGHQVVALAPAKDAMASDSEDELRAQLQEIGVYYRTFEMARTGLNPRQDLAAFRALVTLLRELRPDVVLSYTIKPVIYGTLAAAAAGVGRRYALITGLGYAFLGTGWRRAALRLAVSGLYAVALHQAQRVIFQNPDDRRLFVARRLVPARRTAVVNGSGLDLSHYTPQPLPDAPVFLMIARLLRDKGVGEYVEAARLLRQSCPDARVLLLGPYDYSPGAFTPADVAGWERDAGVEYLGECADVRPVIGQASVYVLPSYREGTPRTVLEAMAMGRPVITTDAPGCRETVIHGQTGYLVPVGEAGPLATRMIELAQDAQKRAEFGRAGVRLAQQKYDVHEVNRQMMAAMDMAPDPRFDSPSRPWRPYDPVKRGLDLLVSLALLLTLSPVLLLVAGLVAWRLGRPVIFTQVRPGLAGQPFTMFKFRTMTDERGPDGELRPDHERLTRLGAWLRLSSLDELPGLWNVVRGEMSLVGPRPLLTSYLQRYTPEQHRRHEVRPGLTGWAQINGRQDIRFSERIRHDVWYVDHRSFGLDLKIMLLTLPRMLAGRGVRNGQDVAEVDDLPPHQSP